MPLQPLAPTERLIVDRLGLDHRALREALGELVPGAGKDGIVGDTACQSGGDRHDGPASAYDHPIALGGHDPRGPIDPTDRRPEDDGFPEGLGEPNSHELRPADEPVLLVAPGESG